MTKTKPTPPPSLTKEQEKILAEAENLRRERREWNRLRAEEALRDYLMSAACVTPWEVIELDKGFVNLVPTQGSHLILEPLKFILHIYSEIQAVYVDLPFGNASAQLIGGICTVTICVNANPANHGLIRRYFNPQVSEKIIRIAKPE